MAKNYTLAWGWSATIIVEALPKLADVVNAILGKQALHGQLHSRLLPASDQQRAECGQTLYNVRGSGQRFVDRPREEAA